MNNACDVATEIANLMDHGNKNILRRQALIALTERDNEIFRLKSEVRLWKARWNETVRASDAYQVRLQETFAVTAPLNMERVAALEAACGTEK